jgi:hypothetical protein
VRHGIEVASGATNPDVDCQRFHLEWKILPLNLFTQAA